MADDDNVPSPDEIRDLIAVTRKRPLAFGLAIGKKPEGTALFMHRVKSAEAMLKLARKHGETPKYAFGEIESKGKKTTFRCEKEPKGAMAKSLKAFFRTIKLKQSIILMGPDGNVLESELDEDDDGQDGQTGDDTGGNELEQKWAKILASLGPQIDAAVKAGKGDVSKIRAAWAYAQENAMEGDYSGALKVAARMNALLTAGDTTGNNEQEPEKTGPGRRALAQSGLLWAQSRAKMLSEMKRLEAEIIKAESADEDNDTEDLQEIQAKISAVYKYLEPFDGRLETALSDVVDARDLKTRQDLLVNCRNILNELANHLKDDFFKVLDDENGYAKVAIASTAQKSIAAIQKMLA